MLSLFIPPSREMAGKRGARTRLQGRRRARPQPLARVHCACCPVVVLAVIVAVATDRLLIRRAAEPARPAIARICRCFPRFLRGFLTGPQKPWVISARAFVGRRSLACATTTVPGIPAQRSGSLHRSRKCWRCTPSIMVFGTSSANSVKPVAVFSG